MKTEDLNSLNSRNLARVNHSKDSFDGKAPLILYFKYRAHAIHYRGPSISGTWPSRGSGSLPLAPSNSMGCGALAPSSAPPVAPPLAPARRPMLGHRGFGPVLRPYVSCPVLWAWVELGVEHAPIDARLAHLRVNRGVACLVVTVVTVVTVV